jgi:hypothetical protein
MTPTLAEIEARHKYWEGYLCPPAVLCSGCREKREFHDDIAFLLSLVRSRDARLAEHGIRYAETCVEGTRNAHLQQALDEANRQCRIRDLAVPIEDELHNRIDEMLKHLATGQGFTLNGVASLLIDCQKRMAADWVNTGNQLKGVNDANRRLAEIADIACNHIDMEHYTRECLEDIHALATKEAS